MTWSEARLDAYLDQELGVDAPAGGSDALGAVRGRMRGLLRAAVRRLDALPAGDPFWEGLTPRPTLYEASRYFPHVLAEHPEDDEARRVLAALDLRWSDNDFGRAYLEPLVARDPAELPWLVAGAIWVERLSGADTLPRLRESLARLRAQVIDFDERVEQQARSDDPFRRRMGEVARAVTNGQRVASLWH